MRGVILLIGCALLLAACGDGGGSGGSTQSTGITAVQLNTLHGTSGQACRDSENCRLADRIDLLFKSIADSGCPDIVTLQETWSGSVPLIMQHLDTACPFSYTAVLGPRLLGRDDEMILTRYPVLATEQRPLFPGFRHALWARIDHPLGPVDVFTTHLASSSDGAEARCDVASGPCPDECLAAGAQTRRDCQAVQMAFFVEEKVADGDGPALVTGDFNEVPDSFVYRTFADRGWVDTYLTAGNPECTPATGVGCTSGRQDESLVDLESPASNEVERIDFIFVVLPLPSFGCQVSYDPASDRDHDGTATRLFPQRPAHACGPAPAPICWPSDHMGVELDLNCK
jgi:endonuclease/exonuclease/phosphatase family metal-dependent hydrolase